MTDTIPGTSDTITIEADKVLHATERDTRHGLSHIEDEFLTQWHRMATYSETEAKKLLAWVASKI